MSMRRWFTVCFASMLLTSCLLTPGRFTSTLDIKRDRSFTFSYVGEAIMLQEQSGQPTVTCSPEDTDCKAGDPDPAAAQRKAAEQEAKLKDMAEALSKETGYRSVRYLSNRKFEVNYQISGTLDRAFIYPFNSDAGAIMPWIAIELRKDGMARVRAPAFGDEMSPGAAGGLGMIGAAEDPVKDRQGTFTLVTDAEIVMQNEEGGIGAGPAGARRITWRVTPTSKIVPTAVLRF